MFGHISVCLAIRVCTWVCTSLHTVTVLLVCPGWPPDVSVCWAHGLLFVVGAMCSHVYCLSPPILLPHHCFSCSTCVPLVTLICLPIYPSGVCSPVLICCFTSCVFHVCLFCSSLPACLFFPFRVFFVYDRFILLLKEKIILHLSPLLISPHPPWQNGSAFWGLSEDESSGKALQYPSGRRKNWRVRQALLGSRSPVGDGEDLPHGHLLGRPGQAFQILHALLGLRGVAGGLHQPGSEFKRLCSRARSVLWAHRVRPEPPPFREPTESAPEPPPISEPTEPTTEPAPFREPTESVPEPTPFHEPTESAPEPVLWAHRVRSRAAPFREPTESESRRPQSLLRSRSPQSPLWSRGPQSPLQSGNPQNPLKYLLQNGNIQSSFKSSLPSSGAFSAPPWWHPALPAPPCPPALPMSPGPLSLHGPCPPSLPQIRLHPTPLLDIFLF